MAGQQSGQALGQRLLAPFRLVFAFTRYFIDRFCIDRGLQVASELSYTTLLSIVPLMAVVFGLMAAFPTFNQVRDRIQAFIFDNFVPAAGEVVEQYLMVFTGNASKITGVGVVFLVVTALMMMATIDRSFNAIWQVREKRNPLASFTVYWAVLTLVPLLIGASLLVSTEVQTMAWFSDAAATIERETADLTLMPFLASALAFFLLYVVVPNRRVPLLHALAGALFAALLFEAAKRGFTVYVSSFHTLANIYGAMATIPIFLIWIFVSWVVALLGAEFTRSLSTFRAEALGHDSHGPGGNFACAYRLLGHLWRAQVSGKGLSTVDLLDREPGLAEDRLLDIMDEFLRVDLVQTTRERAWVLTRDLGELTLADLHNLLPYAVRVLPKSRDPWDLALHQVLDVAVGNLHQHMEVPVKDLYREQAATIAPAERDPA
jgi:membrane protein